MDDIIIVGAGIGGLTLGLALHGAGIPCRIFESAAEIKPVGVGINLLPHATKELAALGLEADLAKGAAERTARPDWGVISDLAQNTFPCAWSGLRSGTPALRRRSTT